MGYRVFLILVFLLCACAPAPNDTPAIPATILSPNATATVLPTASKTPQVDLTATQNWMQFQVTLDALKTRVANVQRSTPTVTIPSSPSPTAIPYQGKQVLIEYTQIYAGLGTFGDFVTGEGMTDLILYSDGQLIIHRKKLYEKKLSVIETCSLLKNIEDFGYYRVVDNGAPDHRDNPLYTNIPPGVLQGSDTGNYHVLVNGPNPKSMWVDVPFFDYVVPAMKETITFLQYYQPTGMEEYEPDRLLLFIIPGRDETVDKYFLKNKTPAQWPEANFRLSDYAVKFKKF